MSNTAYFLAAFLVVCMIGLLSGCAGIHPQNSAFLDKVQIQQFEHRKTVADSSESDYDKWRLQKEAMHAHWWRCMGDYESRYDKAGC